MSSRVSILGSNGYIGRHLAHKLSQQTDDIKLYDVQTKSQDGFSGYQRLDLCSAADIEAFDTDRDTIFLFSGITGTKQGFEDFERFIDINEKGLCHLLEKMRHDGSTARLVFPSTRLIYKGLKGKRLAEDAEKEFKTLYALNKHTAESLIKLYAEYFDLNFSIVRICVPYGNLIGEGYSYGTIGFFLRKAMAGEDITLYGDGSQRRSFIHIADLLDQIAAVAASKKANREILNLGGPDNLSLREAAAMVASKYGVELQFTDWPELDLMIESGDTVFDSSKAEKMLEIEYKYTFHNWINSLSS